MQKQELLIKLNELVTIYNEATKPSVRDAQEERKINAVETIQQLLEEYLKQNPQDTEMWVKLSLTFFLKEDIQSSIECMEKILSYDPNNVYAFILLVWFHDYWPFIPDVLFEKLSNFNIEDKKIMAMAEYLKACYFFTKHNKEMQEKALLKSIEYCDEFVWNNQKLAQLYLYQKRSSEAFPLIIKALKNIKQVSAGEHEFFNFLDIDRHFNEFLTGIWLNDIQYVHIVSMFDSFYVPKEQ
jgi:tetratricopeptide (TPR) repeat protein